MGLLEERFGAQKSLALSSLETLGLARLSFGALRALLAGYGPSFCLRWTARFGV